MSTAVPSFPGAIPPPTGVVADPANAVNAGAATWLACTTVILVVPTLLLFLRLYIKLVLLDSALWLECIVIIGWLCFVAQQGVAYTLLTQGQIGMHGWDLYPGTYARFLELINIQQVIYMPAILFIKVGILIQLLQIFCARKYNARWWTLVTLISFNCLFFTIYTFLTIFLCVPRNALWDPHVQGHCINMVTAQVASGVINVMDDFIILILPIAWVWSLNMTTSRKLSVTVIFAIGLFACASSVVRLVSSSMAIGNDDVTYTLFQVSLWASAEVGSALIVCCLPVLPRLFRKSSPTAGYSSDYKKYGNYGKYGNNRDPVSMRSEADRRTGYTEMDDIERRDADDSESTTKLREDELPHPSAVGCAISSDTEPAYSSREGITKTVTIENSRT